MKECDPLICHLKAKHAMLMGGDHIQECEMGGDYIVRVSIVVFFTWKMDSFGGKFIHGLLGFDKSIEMSPSPKSQIYAYYYK